MPILVSSQTPDDSKNFWATSWAAFCDAETLYGREFAVDVCAEPATTKCRTFIGHPMLYDLLLDYRTGPEIKHRLKEVSPGDPEDMSLVSSVQNWISSDGPSSFWIIRLNGSFVMGDLTVHAGNL